MRNIVSNKLKIYYKMNRQNLLHNMLIPYIMILIISWVFCIGQFRIDSYLYKNFYNSVDKRTLALSVNEEFDVNDLYDYDNIENINEIGRFENNIIYKVVLNSCNDVSDMMYMLSNNEKYEVTKYQSSQPSNDDEFESLEFLAKILKSVHVAYITIALILMIVFVIRESDLEQESLDFLRFLSFSKLQLRYHKISTCIRVLIYGIVVCLLLVLTGVLLHYDVNKFIVDYVILTLPILFAYPLFYKR